MTLNLTGELIPDDWAEVYQYYGVKAGYYSPKQIRDAIAALEDGEELLLEINSIGGNVDCASEIYSMIQKCPNPTRAEIQSLAASAASIFILPCKRVEIAICAQMMIHRSSARSDGNAADHEWVAGALKTEDESLLDAYVARCGEEHRDLLKQMMEAETYIGARQCLEMGLVDAIIGQPDASQPQGIVASATNNIIRAMRTLPDIRKLSEMRDQERSALVAQITSAEKRYN